MSRNSNSGRNVLAHRADLQRLKSQLPPYKDFLVIDDNEFDGEVLRAVLHVWFGYDIDVRSARSIGLGLDCLQERIPDVVFLDDYLPPSDTAVENMPYLRRWGYKGPIIIISSHLNRKRKLQVMEAGAADVIHKDDLSAVGIGEVFARLTLGSAADEFIRDLRPPVEEPSEVEDGAFDAGGEPAFDEATAAEDSGTDASEGSERD
ncbi:MAG: response regulator [Rhizobiales bacterium]|nr:response regulator [Hyphomicrobiales bacterium]